MSKKLNLLYEWIGPKGPITNKRLPTLYDFANSQTDCHVDSPVIIGPKPLYYEIMQSLPNQKLVNLKTPSEITKDSKFIYEIEYVPGTPDFDSFFTHGSGILDKTSINHKVMDFICNGNGYICVSTIYESFLEDKVLDQIEKYFNLNNVPLNKVIYLTNCINGYEVYKNYCDRTGKPPVLNIEYAGVWMRSLCVQAGSSELQKLVYKIELKNKMFLQFNRRHREQRLYFLMQVFKRNLLDNFYISFSDTEPGQYDSFHDRATNLNNKQNIGLTPGQLNDLTKKLPLILDTPDFSKFPMESSLSDTIQFYNDSLIHVIAETNFYTNIIHITEKTMKPIMYKQPFIFVGPPHSLGYLKDMGFRTFSNIWDESYDEEEDHNKRMNMVLDLLERLNSLSDKEKLTISMICSSIVRHNYDLLHTRQWKELANLVEKYGE